MYKFCINAFKKFFSLNKSICSNRKLNFRFWYFIIDNCIRLSNNLKYKLIKLKYFEKKSYYDISKELDVTVGTLRTMNYEIISYIYCVGLDNQIFKEVEVCRNVKL